MYDQGQGTLVSPSQQPRSAPGLTAEFAEKFQPLFQKKRYKVFYGGRGAAKSWSFARALLILSSQRRIRVLCAREIQNSIEDSVHKLLKDQIEALGWLSYFDTPQHAIRCNLTGSEFGFEGIRHNISKIRSYEGADYCWVEEAAKVSKASWDVLKPTMRKEGSEIWVSFNPELDEDYTYQNFVMDPPSDSTVTIVNYWDNPWFPEVLRREMEELRKKDFKSYLHVWEGHCREILDGAIYGEELAQARGENRICAVPYDKSKPVDTFWDLGHADHTAIWFGQKIGMERRVLRYYQNNQKHIDHYLQHLQGLGYVYGTVWLPHDARSKTLGTKKSIEEQVRDKGFHVRIVPNLSIADGINAARGIFSNLWFDKDKCKDGLYCLKNNRYEVAPDTANRTFKRFSDRPIHDQFSHGGDAFRYMGVAWNTEYTVDHDGFVKKFFKGLGLDPNLPSQGSNGWMG